MQPPQSTWRIFALPERQSGTPVDATQHSIASKHHKESAADSVAHTVLLTYIVLLTYMEQKAWHKGMCFDSRPDHVDKSVRLWCSAGLNWIGVRFADGAFKLLENPLPPLVDWVIPFKQLSLADGPKPLQHIQTQHLYTLPHEEFPPPLTGPLLNATDLCKHHTDWQ